MRWLWLVGSGAALVVGTGAGVALALQGSSPAATEIEAPARCQDWDGDGYGRGCAAGPDCNDRDLSVNPGRAEECNFRDDDCNSIVDDAPACPVPALQSSQVDVPGGAFQMGSDSGAADERPVHTVTVSSFRIDRYEVTNARYRRCAASQGCTPPSLLSSSRRDRYYEDPRFDDYPVVFVTWPQADAFCRATGGRLPTEAEWEKTARGTGSLRTYPWGDDPPSCSLANLGGPGSCVGDTDRVGRRLLGASPYGALDMAGNVWEWVADWYDPEAYQQSQDSNPKGPAEGRLKVARGGCWQSGADTLRVSCRKAELPSTWAYNIGFRCAYPEGD